MNQDMQQKRENGIAFRNLGLIDYKEAWDLQEKTLRAVVDEKLASPEGGGPSSQVVFFCEHPHVFTLGRSGKNQNLLIPDGFLERIHASFYRIDRGGDITYHGPGQIVGYPVLDLEARGIKVREYVWKLEESVIRTLDHYSLHGERLKGATGVWLDAGVPGKTRKICAIGVRVSRYVTMHGFAFNVNTDLNYFQYINPCGYTDKGVTSLKNEMGRNVDMREAVNVLKENFSEVFQLELITS
jgi:lipoyl(octanoyl) transferase